MLLLTAMLSVNAQVTLNSFGEYEYKQVHQYAGVPAEGLFTYFLLKELQATGGDVDMGTLTDAVTKQVKRHSVVINNKKQTPSVIPSPAISANWRELKLK